MNKIKALKFLMKCNGECDIKLKSQKMVLLNVTLDEIEDKTDDFIKDVISVRNININIDEILIKFEDKKYSEIEHFFFKHDRDMTESYLGMELYEFENGYDNKYIGKYGCIDNEIINTIKSDFILCVTGKSKRLVTPESFHKLFTPFECNYFTYDETTVLFDIDHDILDEIESAIEDELTSKIKYGKIKMFIFDYAEMLDFDGF